MQCDWLILVASWSQSDRAGQAAPSCRARSGQISASDLHVALHEFGLSAARDERSSGWTGLVWDHGWRLFIAEPL